MPRYYCDYCDTYLTHDSPSVRKQHNAGYKHKANVRTYYQQFEEQQTQSLIDQRIKEHLGQAAAFQVGAAFHQHLATFPPQRPGLPILPTPVLPNPGIRPPVMQPPFPGAPGYGAAPPMPQVGMQPVVTSIQPQLNSLPRMPLNLPATSGAPVSASNNPPAMVNPAMYQMGAVPTSGGFNPNPTVSAPQGSTAGGPAPAVSQTFETDQ